MGKYIDALDSAIGVLEYRLSWLGSNRPVAGHFDKAVLVVHMQNLFASFEVFPNLIKYQREVLSHCQEHNIPVIEIKVLWSGRLGQTIDEIAREIERVAVHDSIVSNDGFKGTKLGHLLRYWGVEEVYITGFNAKALVMETAKAALANGFEISTSDGAIASTIKGENRYMDWYRSQGRVADYRFVLNSSSRR